MEVFPLLIRQINRKQKNVAFEKSFSFKLIYLPLLKNKSIKQTKLFF